jgi:SAM-dependent methyltransferase
MTFKEWISLITHCCASIGVVETFKGLGRYALRFKDSSFDRRNSTDTGGRINKEDLEMSDPEAQSHATVYNTLSEIFIGYLIGHLGINYHEYDFVDIGCGKGRVLLVASSFPFRSICGIELSRPALEIAEKNIRTYHCADQKCFNIHIRKEDARYFEPCIANAVYYIYEPFDIVTMTAVLAKLSSKLRGQSKAVYVICVWYDLARVLNLFDAFGFKTIRSQKMTPLSPFNYAISFLQ